MEWCEKLGFMWTEIHFTYMILNVWSGHFSFFRFTLFAKLFLLTGSIWVIRVVLLVLQIQGLYVTWYGVALEAVFSIPEVVFPIIIFHHPEFIKWAERKSPLISRKIIVLIQISYKSS